MSEDEKKGLPEELDAVVEELKKRKAKFALSQKAAGGVSLPEMAADDTPIPGNIAACDYRACDPPDPDDPPPDDVIGNLAACTIDCCDEDK